MSFATAVAVNSEFTKGVVRRTWPKLERTTELRVVHPCVAVEELEEEGEKKSKKKAKGKKAGKGKMITEKEADKDTSVVEEIVEWKDEKAILSINRFERKKDVGLAIKAFAAIPEERREGVRLIIAGKSQ